MTMNSGAAQPSARIERAWIQTRAQEAASAEKRFGTEAAAAASLGRVAESVHTLFNALQELVQQGTGWRNTAGEQLDGLTERFDQLAEVVFGQQLVNATTQERYEELCQAVASGRETHGRHESDLQSLREGMRERMDWMAVRLEALTSQLDEQRQEISRLQAKVNELEPLHAVVATLSSQVQGWCERLDRQGEVLDALCDAQNQRAAVLDEFLAVLSRWRSATAAPQTTL